MVRGPRFIHCWFVEAPGPTPPRLCQPFSSPGSGGWAAPPHGGRGCWTSRFTGGRLWSKPRPCWAPGVLAVHTGVCLCVSTVTFLVFLHMGVWAFVESLVRARHSIWWAARQRCWSVHISVRGGWGWARARGQAEPGSWIFVLLDACSRLSPTASFLGGGLVSKPRPRPQRPLNTGSGQAGWVRGS